MDILKSDELKKVIKQIVSESTSKIEKKVRELNTEAEKLSENSGIKTIELFKNSEVQQIIKQIVNDSLIELEKKVDDLKINLDNLRQTNIDLIRLLTNKNNTACKCIANSENASHHHHASENTGNLDISDSDSHYSSSTVLEQKTEQEKTNARSNFNSKNTYKRNKNMTQNKNYHNKQPKYILGTADNDDLNEFSAAENKLWLYIGRCKPGTTEDNIKAYLERKCPKQEFAIESLQSKGLPSFKLGANSHLKDTLYNPSFWPKKTLIKRFQFKPFRQNRDTGFADFL